MSPRKTAHDVPACIYSVNTSFLGTLPVESFVSLTEEWLL